MINFIPSFAPLPPPIVLPSTMTASSRVSVSDYNNTFVTIADSDDGKYIAVARSPIIPYTVSDQTLRGTGTLTLYERVGNSWNILFELSGTHPNFKSPGDRKLFVSDDGSVVVGSFSDQYSGSSYRRRTFVVKKNDEGNYVNLSFLPPGSNVNSGNAAALSSDGSIIVCGRRYEAGENWYNFTDVADTNTIQPTANWTFNGSVIFSADCNRAIFVERNSSNTLWRLHIYVWDGTNYISSFVGTQQSFSFSASFISNDGSIAQGLRYGAGTTYDSFGNTTARTTVYSLCVFHNVGGNYIFKQLQMPDAIFGMTAANAMYIKTNRLGGMHFCKNNGGGSSTISATVYTARYDETSQPDKCLFENIVTVPNLLVLTPSNQEGAAPWLYVGNSGLAIVRMSSSGNLGEVIMPVSPPIT